MTREWAMPSKWTFSIAPISALLKRWIKSSDIVVDPFCGKSEIATIRNDISITGLTANDWLDSLVGVFANVVLLDPPYSPRQISECYKNQGINVSSTETQNAKLYRDAIERLDKLLVPGGIAIRCGWSSCGFGKCRGYSIEEILIVCHGGAHNDTIVTVERKN